MTIDKTYDPHAIEQDWYKKWEEANYFAPSGKGDSYCIMIPPPNVTGSLHMGHGFQYTLMDSLIRYNRMQGKDVLWQMGTDHAGIATQMVVERQLEEQGKSREKLGREKFLEEIWKWKEQSGGNISNQLRRMGASVDWSTERFTMDEGLSDAVQEVFIQLYEEGLIYLGKRLVNWDPKFQTAISDLEVISEEEKGHMWHIRYPLVGVTGDIIVATTRPETMLGDMAIAVHPDDKLFKHLIGKKVKVPLTDREIPVVGDFYVDPLFGSGCVKITPAHDFNDQIVAKRHDLPNLNIFTPDAKINENGPEAYQGMDRFDARKQIVKDLKGQGLLVKVEDHKLKIPRGDRSGSIIEPYLTDQWYVKTSELALPAIKAVKNGDIKFVPANWKNTYFHWMHHIEDWCISRHLWWGHRIPAWYDEDGNIYVGKSEEEIRKKNIIHDSVKLTQDEDVLDTWFSSALWPFTTLGWPENTDRLKKHYPTSVLVTGFDIIFFWVARMIMAGLKFTDKIPFNEVYITGLIRDMHGKKMSKSKGNIIDPIDLIDGIDLESFVEKRTRSLMQPSMKKKVENTTRKDFPDGIKAHGTDAVRFTFCALASTGRDIRFDMSRLEGYRNFCNKIWNATRYVLMNTEDKDLKGKMEFSLADKWIWSRLQDTIKNIHAHFETYRFDLIAKELYDFIWHEYCDWYLELSKPILNSEESSEALLRGTRKTLVDVLEKLLRLSHPIMPFITEEIWQKVAPLAEKSGDTIMLQPYPKVNEKHIDKEAADELEWIKSVISNIRNIRGEMSISPSKKVPLLFNKGSKTDKKYFERNEQYLKTLAKVESIAWLEKSEEVPISATALFGELEILIPMENLIDKDAETKRLNKELEKLNKELQRSETKLNNPSYVKKAPPEIVQTQRDRLTEMQSAIAKIQEQIEKISIL